MDQQINPDSLDTLCAALCAAAGVPAPEKAAAPNQELMDYLAGRKADRIFMYNPDAIGQWIFEKYPQLFTEVNAICDKQVRYQTVMPSVTPVCFGTMYTGAQPAVHGITSYSKPIIRIDSIFDAFLRAGKKCAIVALPVCSLGNIFLERDMDYYLVDDEAETNAVASRLIAEDRYDLLVVYNGNYDTIMHKYGPEALESLSEARCNSEAFAMFAALIKEHWSKHNTLAAFAMDHGCHLKENGKGYHGTDMPEDLNICHSYRFFEAAKPEEA